MRPRDTPEEVDRLLAVGWRRKIELDGCGIWFHPRSPNATFVGAANAIAYIEGRPLPHPVNPLMPWMG